MLPKSPFLCYNKTYGSVAQLVEQRPEEPRVTGSSPVGTTIFVPIQKAPCGAFFGGWGCLEYL